METPVVLLVSHTSDELFMLRLALLRRNLQCDLRHVPDGREAVDYLNGTSQYGDRETFPFPVATILTYQLPYRTGLDVAGWARRQSRLAEHPLIMLADTAPGPEPERAGRLNVRCFAKSAEYNDVVDFLETLLPHARAAEAA